MEEQKPLSCQGLALVWMLVLTLAVLAFVVVGFVWRTTLPVIINAFVEDAFLADFIFKLIFVGMMFLVALSAAVGEPIIGGAFRRDQHWRMFVKIAGGLIAFGLLGMLITMVATRL